MKYAHFGILLVLIVVAATAVSGCASGPAAPPASPSPSVTPGLSRSSSLFDTGKLRWFEYRLTPAGGDKSGASDIRFDYTTAAINGAVWKDDRVTMKLGVPDVVVVLDSYYDPVTGRKVGAHMKMTSSGTTISDQDLATVDNQYRSSDIAATYSSSDWPLNSVGTDVVTVDGKSYTCTKYAVGNDGKYGTAWVSQGVPVPVKIESTSSDGTSLWELVGWG